MDTDVSYLCHLGLVTWHTRFLWKGPLPGVTVCTLDPPPQTHRLEGESPAVKLCFWKREAEANQCTSNGVTETQHLPGAQASPSSRWPLAGLEKQGGNPKEAGPILQNKETSTFVIEMREEATLFMKRLSFS